MLYCIQFYGAKILIFFIEKIISLFTSGDIFFDKKDFYWTEILEQNYEAIKKEYLDVMENKNLMDVTEFSKEQLKSVAVNQWSIFPLKVYGLKQEKNCKRCPVTTSCLEQIPNITTAWFSVMKPETYVKPHRGTYKGYLRCLMGIIVPEDNTQAGLVIERIDYHWKTNECVIFDDTFYHSAYNNSNQTRVVLYIDFIRPMPEFLVSISKLLTYLFSKSRYVKNMKLN